MNNPIRDKEDRAHSNYKPNRQVRGAKFEDPWDWTTLDNEREEYYPTANLYDCGFRIVRNK